MSIKDKRTIRTGEEIQTMRGDRLAQIREKRGFTQTELADLLGLGTQQIWRYENGKTAPDGDTVARIATFLNVSSDYLLGIADDPVGGTGLSVSEQKILAALRRGDKFGAIKVIATASE